MTKARYVVTSIIPGASLNSEFIRALNTYCKVNNAKLKVLECDYNYIDDITDNGYNEAVKQELAEFLIAGGYIFNNSLRASTFKSKVNIIDPLASMEALVSSEGNLIVPFPRHRFKSVARSLKHSATPRGIWCTGTISEPYYKSSKSGRIAECYHTLGALSIEIENEDIFHIRQLQFDGQGFYDLDTYYTKDGHTKTEDAVLGISLGDLHPPFLNDFIMTQSISLLKELKPLHVIYHDTFDACTISHHVENKKITKSLILNEVDSLQGELKLTASILNSYQAAAPNAEHHIVKSNHDEHLDRYLDEFRFKEDTLNLKLALELALQLVKYKQADATQGPLEYGLKKFEKLDKFIFHERDSKLALAGIEVLNHGDHSANGAKSNTKQNGLAFTGKLVTGHTHAPEIGPYNNFVNGTSTHLSLEYTNDSGTSSWLNTHTLIYKNGTMTHYHIIP
jgi:hypothetical protein